jgi:hypothetical protein
LCSNISLNTSLQTLTGTLHMLPAATTITAVQLPPAFQLIYLPTQVPAFSLFAGFIEEK